MNVAMRAARVKAASTLLLFALLGGSSVCAGPKAFDPLFPQRKTWWTKRITPYLFTAGRITDRQMKQAADIGFKSIISHWHFNDNMTIGQLVDDEVAYSTDVARSVAEDIVGLEYAVLFTNNESEEPRQVSEIERLTDIINNLEKPILYHCQHSNVSTFFGLLHLLYQNKKYSSFQYKMGLNDFFRRATNMGFQYTDPKDLALIQAVAQAPNLPDTQLLHPREMQVTTPEWFLHHAWVVKPIHKNVYISGQIQSNYIPYIETLFSVYFNLRRGTTSEIDGEPNQEEVTLINVHDKTGTYTNEGRQKTTNLLAARIHPLRSNDYIAFDSDINYQARNPLEFGDDIGYNETLSRIYIEHVTTFEYVHTPIGDKYTYNKQMLDAFLETWVSAIRKPGNVMFQCRRGYRAIIVVIAAAAIAYNKSSAWALDKALQADYFFEEGRRTNVVEFFREYLRAPTEDEEREYNGNEQDSDEAETPTPSKGSGNPVHELHAKLLRLILCSVILVY